MGHHPDDSARFTHHPPTPQIASFKTPHTLQFIDTFDEIFRTEGLKIPKTPVRTPVANALAERWIGSIRRELLYVGKVGEHVDVAVQDVVEIKLRSAP